MKDIIKRLDKNYIIDDSKIKNNCIYVLKIRSEKEFAECPYCHTISKRIHSRYEREIQDLPIQGLNTILLVQTRKFFCDNKQCTKKTFSERHPFVGINGKITKRLEDNIIIKTIDLSSVAAAKQLKEDGIIRGKSSICSMLKKNALHCG